MALCTMGTGIMLPSSGEESESESETRDSPLTPTGFGNSSLAFDVFLVFKFNNTLATATECSFVLKIFLPNQSIVSHS